jgi:hypothetical protein
VTKSKGIGRGGARPNTGPKRQPGSVELSAAAQSVVASLEPKAEVMASGFKSMAIETLAKVMQFSPMDGARVSAAKEMLARADKEEAPADHGKKALLKDAAAKRVSEGGKFSAPPPPASVSVKTVQ